MLWLFMTGISEIQVALGWNRVGYKTVRGAEIENEKPIYKL